MTINEPPTVHRVWQPQGRSPAVLLVGGFEGNGLELDESLRSAGFDPTAVATLEQAQLHLARSQVDLLVVDLVLPDGCGLDLIPRADTLRVPIVIAATDLTRGVTARCLRAGADDVVGQPLDTELFELRARALLRRAGRILPDRIAFRNVMIDVEGRRVFVNNRPVELTTKEFDLLSFLAANPGKVYTRHQLLARVWHSSSAWQQPATVTEHVRRLRSKIEDDPIHPTILTTVRGVGYRLERRAEMSRDVVSGSRAS